MYDVVTIDESNIGHAINHAELMGIDCLSKEMIQKICDCNLIKQKTR